MSYAIYKSEALVLRSIPQGEANIDVVLFTREFGKVTARVQSARKAESKMRMHLARYGRVVVDLVRGKSVWRLTGITGASSHDPYADNLVLRSIHRTFRLAEFLIQGEEAHPELFLLFVAMLEYSEQHVPCTAEASEGLELFGVVKVLEKLGYWNGETLPDEPEPSFLEGLTKRRSELVKMINESISATQIVLS